jgi:glycosyltransferase involved in cell wall biosynthesis
MSSQSLIQPLKVALVAPPEETAPPTKYGGTELVVAHLADELVRRGHDVTLYSVGGSKTLAKLIEVFDQPLRLNKEVSEDPKLREAYKYVAQGRIISDINKKQFDIVHNHSSWRMLPFHELFKAPLVTTHHGPQGEQYYHTKIYRMYKDTCPLISITDNQRQGAPDLNYLATVYNGIDIQNFTFNDKPDDYLAFLARFSPEKGPLQAIHIAKKLGKKLLIGAKIDPVDQKFYDDEIKPLIDGKQIVYLGELGLEDKVNLLKNAQALLAPIQWDEPFGLYFIEAMACGTPVLSIARGSAPEVVGDGVGGFLGQSEDDLVSLYAKVSSLDRATIRQRVVDMFSVKANADGYERAYAKLLNIPA